MQIAKMEHINTLPPLLSRWFESKNKGLEFFNVFFSILDELIHEETNLE
jgi:hypothetical protein